MKRAGRGRAARSIPTSVPASSRRCDAAAKLAGRPLSVLLVQVDAQPKLWRETLDQVHGVRAAGRAANAQVGSRPIGVIMGLETTVHPFAAHPVWRELRELSPAERYARLAGRCRPAPPPRPRRRSGDGAAPPSWRESFHKMFPIGDRPDYEPDATDFVAAIAERTGRTPQEVALEVMMAHGGKGLLMLPFENYAYGSLDVVHEMITDPGDGAGRGRWRRPCRRDLRRLLADLAAHPVGPRPHAWTEAGARIPGRQADARHGRGLRPARPRPAGARATRPTSTSSTSMRWRLKRPEVVYDLPAGGRRLIQRATGYRHTFNAGVETIRNDELTGERPGTSARGGPGATTSS